MTEAKKLDIEHLFKRIDQSKIEPKFLELCKDLIRTCLAQGKEYHAISGFRDGKEQETLFAIGRTTEMHRKPVTNAAPYRSFHNFGYAIDFCLDADVDKMGLQPDWDIEEYKLLADEAVKLGLRPGYYFKTFKEGPHIEMPGHKLPDLETIYKSEGLQAVWAKASP